MGEETTKYASLTRGKMAAGSLSSTRWRLTAFCVFLGLAILLIYWQVLGFDFFDLDDISYVRDNDMVKRGLTLSGIRWAFTSVGYSSNWHPLTWISHMLDVQMFGMNPGMHHFTNVLLHIINSVLLLLVLDRMTGAFWKSATVAALFALHPLHVESVAWIAERKDVLSAFFWILTMAAYAWYTRRPSVPRYMAVAALLVSGLLSKPMVVTLPFVLLLLDYWPLNRMRPGQADIDGPGTDRGHAIHWPRAGRLAAEKIPLIAASLATSYLTIIAQHGSGTMKSLESLPLGVRLENALSSYVAYLFKMVYPVDLAVFYPYDPGGSLAAVLAFALVLSGAVLTVVLCARRHPYLPVGLFWYLGTLVPVIGLVQVGNQAMADRYTYIPLVGIFILLAWGVPGVLSGFSAARKAMLPAATMAALIILGFLSWKQAAVWTDSQTLYEHAIEVTEGNTPTHLYYAKFLLSRGELEGAERHCAEALRAAPDAYAYNLMGMIRKNRGDISGAIGLYTSSIQIDPGNADAYNSLGVAFMLQGRSEDAYRAFSKALELDPENVATLINMSNYLKTRGRMDEAINYFNKAASIRPEIVVQ